MVVRCWGYFDDHQWFTTPATSVSIRNSLQNSHLGRNNPALTTTASFGFLECQSFMFLITYEPIMFKVSSYSITGNAWNDRHPQRKPPPSSREDSQVSPWIDNVSPCHHPNTHPNTHPNCLQTWHFRFNASLNESCHRWALTMFIVRQHPWTTTGRPSTLPFAIDNGYFLLTMTPVPVHTSCLRLVTTT